MSTLPRALFSFRFGVLGLGVLTFGGAVVAEETVPATYSSKDAKTDAAWLRT